MPAREHQPLVVGLPDEAERVDVFFAAFAWDGETPDAETLSAEAFLAALGP